MNLLEARISDIFNKNPNLKKNFFWRWGGGMEG